MLKNNPKNVIWTKSRKEKVSVCSTVVLIHNTNVTPDMNAGPQVHPAEAVGHLEMSESRVWSFCSIHPHSGMNPLTQIQRSNTPAEHDDDVCDDFTSKQDDRGRGGEGADVQTADESPGGDGYHIRVRKYATAWVFSD